MLQVLIQKGHTVCVDVPAPTVGEGCVLIKVANSCISAGTEVSSVHPNRDSLLKKAIKQPDKVAKAFQMAKSEGISRTVSRIRGQLDSGVPTGYSISGTVVDLGQNVNGFAKGERVAAAGAGMANHAEYVLVPKNLVVRLPDNVSFQEGATVTMGTIALHAVRRADIKLGEYATVVGTGILGMLAVQILSNAGARVIAVDIDKKRLKMAREMGAELCIDSNYDDFVDMILHFTHGRGTDAMLFCASTDNPKVLSNAFAATRKKGRVVMVGIWGKELNRDDIYAKELDFLISTSYGPGRYDTDYEIEGRDYPYAYVRWTENRNMSEYLRLISAGKLMVQPLIQAEYPVEKVNDAFEALCSENRPLISILNYDNNGKELNTKTEIASTISANIKPFAIRSDKRIRVAVIGAGNFAYGVHLPNLEKLNRIYQIHAICSRGGDKAHSAAKRFGAKYATTDYEEILADEAVDLVMICTRHNLHGELVLESLKASKHTFVEKPLCITREELDAIKSFYICSNQKEHVRESSTLKLPLLMVGFNRRFSPFATELKKHIKCRINPAFIHYRMNAGYLPPDHWVHGKEGGGRIVGEACHIIDLFSFLIESKVRAANAASLCPKTENLSSEDNKAITIEYEDGSVVLFEYFSVGSHELPKELLEVHYDQKTIIVENYTNIKGYGIKVKNIKSSFPNKGQLQELIHLSDIIFGKRDGSPISLRSIFETTDLCFRLCHR